MSTVPSALTRALLLGTLFTPISWFAQTAHAQDPSIATITVTARRRVEKLQNVPLPISVISGAELRRHGTDQMAQLQFSTPSLNVSLPNPRQTNLAIRGIGNNPASNGLASSVGIYIDGVYLDRPGMGDFNLVDIAQVEVLRGPQGTLFGKNTTAGALNITTVGPDSTFGGSASVDVGNYGLRTEKISLTGPILPGLDFRVSAYDTTHSSYLKDLVTGQPLLDLKRDGVNGQLLYHPDGLLSVRLISEFSEQNDHQGAFVLFSPGPTTSTKPGFTTYAQWLAREGITPLYNRDTFTSNITNPQSMRTRAASVSGQIDWNVAGGTLTSISAARNWQFTPANSGDWSNANAVVDSGARDVEVQASQELRFASATGGKIDYVAGLYGFWRRESSQSLGIDGPNFGLGLGAPTSVFNNSYAQSVSDPTTYSIAAFGQGTYHATPKLDVTVGLRETYETDNENMQRFALVTPSALPLPPTGTPFTGSLSIANANYAALGTVSYKLTPSNMVYATATRGAKAGGFNAGSVPATFSGVPLPMSSLIVLPEKESDFEVGSKNTFFNNKLVLNADLFWAVVENYQASTYVPGPGGILYSALTNVGLVRSRGAEADATLRVTPDLTLGGSAGFNDARYLSFRNGPAVQGVNALTQDLSGRPVTAAPRLTFNVSANYHKPINDRVDGYAVVSYGYKSGFYGNLDDSTYSWTKPVGLTDARVGTSYENGLIDVSLWVKNAFDQKYFSSTFAFGGGSGGYFAAPSDPRTYGISVSSKF
jgi:iron complex outermembrane receptor protein